MFDDIDAFVSAFSSADCAVVALGAFDVDRVYNELMQLRRDFPFPSVVVVAPKEFPLVVRFKDVVIEEIVWEEAIESELPTAVRKATAARLRARLAQALYVSPLSPELKVGLRTALTAERSITTVDHLTRATGLNRTTLWRRWQSAFHGVPPFTIREFLDRVLVLRALELRATSSQGGAAAVAGYVGVSEHTLNRKLNEIVGTRVNRLLSPSARAEASALGGELASALRLI